MLIISQQGQTIASLEGGIDVGDLEYIEGKVLAGDYFEVSGDINNLNDTIEFVVPSGRRAFLIEAHVSMTSDNAFNHTPGTNVTTVNKITANLQIDGVEKDRIRLGDKNFIGETATGEVLGAGGDNFISNQKFSTLGKSLVGDAVKKIEIENILDSGAAFATMSGYLV